ncbi:MAG: ribbon-helix-helix protein, CopG family [Desulfurococcales archaeon]|nr:ribbon-helix-helix protein, CopG family [Desulfurococcales archaeon]
MVKKQVKFYLEQELYDRLRTLADEQGTTVPQLVRSLVLEYLGEARDGNLVSRVRELEEKYEQLAKELGRVEKDLALLMKRCSRE